MTGNFEKKYDDIFNKFSKIFAYSWTLIISLGFIIVLKLIHRRTSDIHYLDYNYNLPMKLQRYYLNLNNNYLQQLQE